jgi:large subunit ribosomal protein L21
MYAVISSGGKQYRLTEGALVDVERIGGQAGDPVVFDQVLFLGDGESGRVGQPVIEGARVLGTIVEQGKGDKIVVFKFKRRKMYRRRTGHRQELTRVRIESIQTEGQPGAAREVAATTAKAREATAEPPSAAGTVTGGDSPSAKAEEPKAVKKKAKRPSAEPAEE